MGSCLSLSCINRTSDSNFFQNKKKVPNTNKFPDKDSTQIASKKDVLFSNKCLQQEEIEFSSTESMSYYSEERINLPYLFDDKNVDIMKKVSPPKNKSKILHKSSSHYRTKKSQKIAQIPIEKKIEVREYFRPEFYNEMFNDIMNENLNSYDGYECLQKKSNSKKKLQIYLQSYKNSKGKRIDKFRTEFIVPCTAQQFLDIANDLEVQIKIDTYCDENKILESLEENIKLYYLSYRKTFLSSPREFVYLKMIKSVEHDGKKYWCDASKSIDTPLFPILEKNLRCNIIKSGHLIEDLSTEKQSKCLIKYYSECDLRIDLSLFVVRNFSCSEMNKFVDKTIKKVKELNKKRSKNCLISKKSKL